MNAVAEYFLIFSAALFASLILLCVRRARRYKEKINYVAGLVFGLLSLAFISLYFTQIVWFFLLMGVAFLIGLVSVPFSILASQREADKQLQETNVMEPLKARELLDVKGWYKLTCRWGIPKTVGLYALVTFTPLIPLLFVAYIADLSVMCGAIGGVTAGTVGIIRLYQQLKRSHLSPQENPNPPPLPEPPT